MAGDQRDYRYGGRSQICLLNNNSEGQRVQTDENMHTKTTNEEKMNGGDEMKEDCESRGTVWGCGGILQ